MKIVIVGAGVVGLAAAYRLIKDGHEVTVVEAGAYGQGPSHGNDCLVTNTESFPVPAPGTMGIALRSFFKRGYSPVEVTPRWTPEYAGFLLRMAGATLPRNFVLGTIAQEILSRITFETYDEYHDDGLEFEERRVGSLHVFQTREAFDEAMQLFEQFPSLRARVEDLPSRGRVEAVDDGIAEHYRFGYFAPGDRQVEPESLMAALVAAIKDAGGEIIEHTPVDGFLRRQDGTVSTVLTRSGGIDADAVVVAAGVGSRTLLKGLGLSLPLYSGGGYSLDVPAVGDVQPKTSVLTDVTHIAVTPLDRGLRVCSGMIIGQREPQVLPSRIHELVTHLHELYPGITPTLADESLGWAGLRPMSGDGVPVIGAVPGAANAYVATGHAMLGLTYAPATAKVLSELISGEPVPGEYELLAPSRFAGSPLAALRAVA